MSGVSIKNERGMSLVEVLVAFAILAGVVVSVMGLIGQNARYIISAEERLLAAIAVDNLMTEELARLAQLSEGAEEGEIAIASRPFVYQRNIVELRDGVVRIEYAIRAADSEQTLARATVLKGQ